LSPTRAVCCGIAILQGKALPVTSTSIDVVKNFFVAGSRNPYSRHRHNRSAPLAVTGNIPPW